MVVELPYTLHSRYASIATAWTVIIIPSIFINLGLFYGLWYGKPEMDRVLVLTIPTAVLGIFTIIAIVERVWKVTRRSPEYRPLNSPRYALDVFQWGYFLALLCISALISSTLARGDDDHDGHEFQIRLLSLPAAVLMFLVATLTLLSLVLNQVNWKVPFRMGSFGPGNVVKPAIYYIIEDIVAVDGDGGIAYREAFVGRYDSSPVFRRMIRNLSLVWMLGFYVLAVGFTVFVFYAAKGGCLCYWLGGALSTGGINGCGNDNLCSERIEEGKGGGLGG